MRSVWPGRVHRVEAGPGSLRWARWSWPRLGRALGKVVQTKKPDFLGEAGEVSVRVHFLRVGDKKVEIQGAVSSADTLPHRPGSQGIIKAGTLVKALVVTDRRDPSLNRPSQGNRAVSGQTCRDLGSQTPGSLVRMP